MSHPLSLACLQLCERMCKQQWRDRAVRHPKAEAPPQGLTWPSVQDVRVAQAKGAVFTERQRKGVEELPFKKDCVDNCKVLGLASSHHSITEAYK